MKTKRRRRQLMINRWFQWRLIGMFLTLVVIGVGANFCFLKWAIHPQIEEHLYQSHINFDNLNEVLFEKIVMFNAFLLVVVAGLTLLFYRVFRRYLQAYFSQIEHEITYCMNQMKGHESFEVSAMFGNFDVGFQQYFDLLEKDLARENAFLAELKRFLDSPQAQGLEGLKAQARNLSVS